MNAQLETIVHRFETARGRLHELADALPEERWAARRDPDRWSVAECVAHLNLTSHAYLPLLRGALAEARALGSPPSPRYRMSPAGWLLSRAVGPLPRLGGIRLGRTKTAAAFVPTGDLPRSEILAEFDRLQEEQIALTRAADGLPVDRVRILSPFDARVRYDAYSALVLLPRHQERHLIQAAEVWG